MTATLTERLARMKEQTDKVATSLIESQIREGIPTIFAVAGYTPGTYEIKQLARVEITGQGISDGTYMELVIKLSGEQGDI